MVDIKRLFNITEESNATKYPMVWVDISWEPQRGNERQVGSVWFLVNRTLK